MRALIGRVLPLLLLALIVTGSRAETARSATVVCLDRPPTIAGRVVRVLYVVAADAPEQGPAYAQQIDLDISAISSWWREQDPTREPRFELAAAGCGNRLDIGVLRLSDTEATLSALGGRYERIAESVVRRSDGSPFVKYLVFYAGRVNQDVHMCGQGDGESDGAGVAVVYVAACPAVPSEVVAAHELIHALGGVARSGPPNLCPSSIDHVCDSNTDILYPVAPRLPLHLLSLDSGHDDYYGHASHWRDIRDSRWLRHLDDQVSLRVVSSGRGRVVSNVPGVLCRAICGSEWDAGTFVSLAAVSNPGSRFVRWSGACRGSGRCNLELRRATVAKAVFVSSR